MSDIENNIHYAQAWQVPDMRRGFTIQTSYGEIVVSADEAAPFAALTETLLAGRLAEQEAN